MDLLDDGGAREAEDVVGTLEVTRMGGELRAAVGRLVEPVALDHRPHRSVEDEDAAIEQLTKFGGTVRLCHSILQKKKKPRLKLRGISRSRTQSTAGSLAFFNLVASGPANQSRSGEVTAASKALSNAAQCILSVSEVSRYATRKPCVAHSEVLR